MADGPPPPPGRAALSTGIVVILVDLGRGLVVAGSSRCPPLPRGLRAPPQASQQQVGTTYANALVGLAQESKALEAIHADIDAFQAILKVRLRRSPARGSQQPRSTVFPSWRLQTGVSAG